MEPGIYLINFVFSCCKIKTRAYIICKLDKRIDSYSGEIIDSIRYSIFPGNSKKIISKYKINYLNKSYIFEKLAEGGELDTEEIFKNYMFFGVINKLSRNFGVKLISHSVTKLL